MIDMTSKKNYILQTQKEKKIKKKLHMVIGGFEPGTPSTVNQHSTNTAN